MTWRGSMSRLERSIRARRRFETDRVNRPRRILLALLCLPVCLAVVGEARAQRQVPGQAYRFEREPVLPGDGDIREESEPKPTLDLPPLDRMPRGDAPAVENGFVLRGFRILGNTVLTDVELAEAVAPFLDRKIDAETLPVVTDTLTRRYVDAGYISSGAIVPDQAVENGILEIHIIEGRVGQFEVETSGRLRARFVEARMRSVLEGPLRLPELDEALRILQLDERIARVDAVVVPTETFGESRLRLDVEEAQPWRMEGRVANDLAPALGGRRGVALLEHKNVLGLGDTFFGTVSGARGLIDFELGYFLPVTPWLTEIYVRGGFAEAEIVEGDFASDNFQNELASYSVGLVQPLIRGLEDEATLTIGIERRTSELTFTDSGTAFLLETNGDNGDSIHLLMLRLETEWIHRELDRIFAARVRASFGLDAWDATAPNSTATPGAPRTSATLPDAEFQSILIQMQYAERVETPIGVGEIIARTDLQWASGSLFSLESFSMGGASTVRGYHENAIVTDNGWLGSLEFRLPVLPSSLRPHTLRVAPFLDMGYAWDDHDAATSRFDRLFASVGLGMIYRYGDRFEIRAYYGEPLINETKIDGESLQDRGLHLEASLFVF